MRIVVSGGAGFLGSYVAGFVANAGHDVAVLDRVPPRYNEVPHLAGDLLSLESVESALEGADAVFHLGAVGDVYLAMAEPYTAAQVNVVGTANVLEAALRRKVGKVVYASTWEVYGHPDYQPIDEQHPARPDHPYNITKLAGEQLVLSYDALKGLPGVALRLGTAYGPNMRPNSVFSLFINNALAGKPITIKGTGEQARQFTHTSDIARGFLLAGESEIHGEAFNLVAPESISIRQLAEMVAARIPTRIEFEEARQGDIFPSVISSAHARARLGWEARTSFAEGLSELIDHVQAKAGVGDAVRSG
jgi:UDP-glucose 4-epimerase